MYSCAMTVMSMNLDGASCWHLFLVHSLYLFLGACDEEKNILQKQHLKASAKVTEPPVHESLVNRPLTVTVHVTRCIIVRKQIILSNKFSRGVVNCGVLFLNQTTPVSKLKEPQTDIMLDLARPFPSATCPGDIYKENHCCLRLVKRKSDEDFDVLHNSYIYLYPY